MEQTILFERLGGREGVAAVVEKAIANHYDNPLVKSRFELVTDQRSTLTNHAVEFFCTGLSGVPTYTGRPMDEAHRGMNISEAEFVSVLDDILEALVACDVGDLERAEVLGILYGMKADVVHQ